MTPAANPARRFSVHTRDDAAHTRIVEEGSFEAAALAYIEDAHPPADAENEVSLVVRDLEGGREHCLRIGLDSGQIAPCG